MKVLQNSFISIKAVESIPPVKAQSKAEEMRKAIPQMKPSYLLELEQKHSKLVNALLSPHPRDISRTMVLSGVTAHGASELYSGTRSIQMLVGPSAEAEV